MTRPIMLPLEDFVKIAQTGERRFHVELTDLGAALLHHDQAHSIRYVACDHMDLEAVKGVFADILFAVHNEFRRE